MHHKGVEEARELFYQGQLDEEGYQWDAGEGARDLKRLAIEISAHLRIFYEIVFLVEDNPETVRGTIGTYIVKVRREDNVAVFQVENVTGWESFSRTPWGPLLRDRPREAFGPGGDFSQIYTWREPIPLQEGR